MALSKQLTARNGVQTNYHRIVSIVPNYSASTCDVTVRSYVSEDYRATEQSTITSLTADQEWKDELDLLTMAPTEENLARIQELSELVNSFERPEYNEYDPQFFAARDTVYTVSVTNDDMSRTALYVGLKAFDDFTDATDV